MDENKGSLNGKELTLRRVRDREECMEDMGCVEVEFADWKNTLHTYTYCEGRLDLSLINEDKSKELQCRIQTKVIPKNIIKYAIGMSNGNTFPAIVLFMDSKGKLHIIGDGLHTFFAALSLGITHIIGYYIFSHPDPDLVVPLFNIRSQGGDTKMAEPTLAQAAKSFNSHEDDCRAEGKKLPIKKKWANRYSLSQTAFNTACRCLRGRHFCQVHDIDPDLKPLCFTAAMDKIASLSETNPESALAIAELSIASDLQASESVNLCEIFLDKTTVKTLKARQKQFDESKLEIQMKTKPRKAEKKSPRLPDRTIEEMLKDSLIIIGEKIPSANRDIFKNMIDEHPTLLKQIKVLVAFLRSCY